MLRKTDKQNILNRFASKGIFPFQMAFTLLIPLRNIFLSPAQLAGRLELNTDSVVMEVGPGPGYFSPRIAGIISKGRLILADIQPEMLEYARKRMERKGLGNVGYYRCSGERFEFPESTFDRIFMVTVIGEVENKDIYMSEFYRILKPGGILSVTELAGDPDKLTISEVRKLAESHAFSFYRQYGNEKNYTVNFKKIQRI
ncbi:MAG: class I SAM-dependent methyltransferase [Bacteroidales bacterium]|nr:class I SAM-dependent methyltransferase [Bacteroidales bacterium]